MADNIDEDRLFEDVLEKKESIDNDKSDDRDKGKKKGNRKARKNSRSAYQRTIYRQRSMANKLRKRNERAAESKSEREKYFEAIVTSKNGTKLIPK